MQSDELKRRISAGRGDALADLVLKNARIVNVFTDEIDTADIAISGNSIVGVRLRWMLSRMILWVSGFV